MTWLVAGVLLWSLVHFSPSLAPGIRRSLSTSIGEPAYKGLFASLVVLAVILMVLGWRSHSPVDIRTPSTVDGIIAAIFVFAALFLFSASFLGSNVRRIVPHPQLAGVVLWAAGHLVVSNDDRSIVLFVGLALWAVIQTRLLNRRDGKRPSSEPLPITAEIKPLAAAVAAFALLVFVHPYLSGVALV